MLNEEKIDIKTEIDTADFSVDLLQEILTNNHVSVAKSALQQACNEVNAIETSLSPLDRIGLLLGKLKIKTIKAVLMPWSKFDRRQLPALVFFDNQWCRAYEFDDDKVYLVDAQNDKIEVLASALSDAQVLWLKNQDVHEEDLLAVQGEVPTAKRLVLKSLLRRKRWLVEVIVATVVVNLLAVMTSLFAMQVYDRVVPSFSYATLWALSMGMMIVVAMDWLLKYIRARLLDSAAKRVDQEVSQHLFEHLMRLRLDLRSKSLGTLAAQASSAESIRAFFSSTLVFALSDLPFAILFIGFIAIIGGNIGWVYAGLLPIALIVGWMANKQLQRLSANELQKSNERQGLLVESIQGAEAIQSHGAGWRFADKWYDLTKSIAQYSQKNKQITSITTTTAASLGTFAYVVAIGVGVYEIEAGALTIGGLIASTILGGRVIAPISQSVQIMAQWQQVKESMALVDQILKMETIRQPNQSLLVVNQKPETVSLQGVRFSYPDVPVVRLSIPDITFKSGDRVLLLGTVGSGKSTLLKVLAGIYKPSEGRVKLGQADLWELDPQVVVNQVSYLPQDVQLFKGTLKTNLGLVASSDDELLAVSSALGVDAIAADNPKHMEMEIAEGGVGLSVGQRQLIGLGRVILAKPTVWLLDEPTASLDSESELRVIQTLQASIKPEDIVLIATHRTSLLSLANRVLIMKGGEVVMDTTPELLKKNGIKRPSTGPAVPSEEI